MSDSNAATRPPDAMHDPEEVGSDEHLEDGTDLGAIRIHNDVIAVIARHAAMKIPGVADMSGTFVDGIAGMIGRKSQDRGIRVEVHDNAVSLDLHVVLDYGVRIPQVCWQLQNDLRETVETMTGKTVKEINVVVQDIRMPPPPPAAPEERVVS